MPSAPTAGVKLVMVGALMTTKGAGLVAVPPGVVMLTGAVTAVAGTLAVIVESSTTAKLPGATATAPKRTALAPVKVVPAIVTTVVATTPSSGVRLVILGTALNAVALSPLPAGLVTLRIPVSAPAGTTTCSDVAVTAVGTASAPPANVTSEESVRPMPLIVIVVPTVAAAGVSEVMGHRQRSP